MDYYRKIDGYIDRLVQAAGPETDVVILSDHGAGPLFKDVFLNEWLRQQGYLALEQEVASYRGYRSILARLGITRRGISAFLQKRGLGRLETWLTERLGDLVFILPRTPWQFPTSIDCAPRLTALVIRDRVYQS
jgi:predicted AlkP superfamily phosphohydrolase/phosphomutase